VGRRAGSPPNKVAWVAAYLHTKWHFDPSNCLATVHQRYRQTDNGLIAQGQPFYKRSPQNPKHWDSAYLRQGNHRHQNLIICSLDHCQSSLRISCKSVWIFFCTKLLTDRPTNNDDYITSLAEVMISININICCFYHLRRSLYAACPLNASPLNF